jgi:hypothetical protein
MESSAMQKITMTEITAKMSELPPGQLTEVYNFVSFLVSKKKKQKRKKLDPELIENMQLAESSFSLDWNTPEEDKAWADL